jgi:hypothetical protein
MTLFQWRRLAAGELDHERLWLAVGAGAAVMTGVGARVGLRLPRCVFHTVTGYPCPGCGSTRALRQLWQGNVTTALWFNPLMTLAALAAGVWALYAAAVLIGSWPRLRVGHVSPARALGVRIGVIAAVLANWGWVIAHGM